jgi:hypothetical protein
MTSPNKNLQLKFLNAVYDSVAHQGLAARIAGNATRARWEKKVDYS